LRVKAHLAATTVVAVVNPIQLAPASTAWLVVGAVVHAVTVVAVVVAAMVVAVAAAVALAVVVVVDMAAAVVAEAVAVRSAADRLYFEPASALVH
jgi:hypothetical protein